MADFGTTSSISSLIVSVRELGTRTFAGLTLNAFAADARAVIEGTFCFPTSAVRHCGHVPVDVSHRTLAAHVNSPYELPDAVGLRGNLAGCASICCAGTD